MIPEPDSCFTVVALENIYSIHFGEEVSHVLGCHCPGETKHTGQVGRNCSKSYFGWEVGHVSYSPHPTAFIFDEVESVEESEGLEEVPEVNGETVPHEIIGAFFEGDPPQGVEVASVASLEFLGECFVSIEGQSGQLEGHSHWG